MVAWVGVAAREGVGTLGGVDAHDDDDDRDSVGVRGGVSAHGGIGVWGDVRVLCLCTSGSSSASSLSSVRSVMTLCHFWLLSSSLMFKGPPVPTGPEAFLSQDGPSDMECFPITFLDERGSLSPNPSPLLSLLLRVAALYFVAF